MQIYLKQNIDDWTNEKTVGIDHNAQPRKRAINRDIYAPGMDIPDKYKIIIFNWLDQVANVWCQDLSLKNTVMNITKAVVCSYSINDKVHMTSLQGIGLVILRMVIKIIDDNHYRITNHDVASMSGHVYTYKQINMFECHVLRYTSTVMKILT